MALDPSQLRAALAPLRRPIGVAQAEREFGGGSAGRVALAQAIAGTTDKKSRAYKSAMRTLQRNVAGEGKQRRGLGQDFQAKIGKAVQTKRAASRLTGTLQVRWKAPTIRVSADARQRPDFSVSLEGEELAEVAQLLDAGDDEEAMEVFAAASLAAYFNAERSDARIIDAAGLTIRRED